jgi:large subunit ribosomal protein L22
MESRAITKFVRISPRKMRLVVDQIRGRGVEEALNVLKFIPKRSAGLVAKTLRTAVANAENTQSVDVDRLYVKGVKVDEAGMWKRFTPRAQGRATRIRKRLSHVTIILDEFEERS